MRPLAPVTQTEIEVLRAIWEGKNTTKIAEERFVSVKTIESHRASLFFKAGIERKATNLIKLIHWGLEKGYLKP